MESVTANRWRAEGKAEVFVRFLNRWNPPDDLTNSVRALRDIPRLDALTDIAFTASSLDDFRRAAGL